MKEEPAPALIPVFEAVHAGLAGAPPSKQPLVSFYPYVSTKSTIRDRDGRYLVRISDHLHDAPDAALRGVMAILLCRAKGWSESRIDTTDMQAYRDAIRQERVEERRGESRRRRGRKNIDPVGDHRSLLASYLRVSMQMGMDLPAAPRLSWSKTRSTRRFGHQDADHDCIVISRTLDDPKVPEFVLDYVVYHELLHIVIPPRMGQGGKRIIHPKEFKQAEARFPKRADAERWLTRLASRRRWALNGDPPPRGVYGALRRAMFLMDPERAHHLATAMLRKAQDPGALQGFIQAPKPDPRLANRVAGIDFASPLGMAAGFDKEAQVYNALMALGFSHVELGTVTPKAQPGNPTPRVQRFPRDKAVVNRMGFPGPGAETIAHRIRDHPPIGPLGINIGPNKDNDADQVAESILFLADRLSRHADYLAVNVSSPNTPGLRDLQTPKGVARLLREADDGQAVHDLDLPVFLKVHPDAPADEILAVARSAVDAGADGIIAVNTTKDRTSRMARAMEGGMSGAPLLDKAADVVAHLYNGLGRDTPIIGVGGVMDGASAFRLIQAGASLVQTYTGFIYGGPRMPVKVQKGLVKRLDQAGLDRITEAVGMAEH